ncbi:MAG: aquaporin Z [Labilithrix sp.]|nr:aquaporin Z [Labilithrix sp.]
MQSYTIMRRATAEILGTFWLVLGGCGAAVLGAKLNVEGSAGLVRIALAFGLALMTGAFALGSISGAHFNPAVTVGLAVAKRVPKSWVVPYVLAQLVGATLAGGVLYFVARGAPMFDVATGFATNGYGAHSPGGYGAEACFVAEVVMTAMFVLVILAMTRTEETVASKALAPLAIGLCLTLIHLVMIPVTSTSVNPARSTGVALFAGGAALAQLWFFWVAPLAGGLLGAAIYRAVAGREQAPAEVAVTVTEAEIVTREATTTP